jgi:hypothetical protein
MKSGVPRKDEGFDIVINGANQLFADLELSAIASAGFHKEHYPEDTVQIRTRSDGTLRTVLGHARLEPAPNPELMARR